MWHTVCHFSGVLEVYFRNTDGKYQFVYRTYKKDNFRTAVVRQKENSFLFGCVF